MDENCGIYVVKNDDRKEIKIGWSANIQKNIIQLIMKGHVLVHINFIMFI